MCILPTDESLQEAETCLIQISHNIPLNSFYCPLFPSRYFILEIARSNGLAGIIFHLRLEGKKHIRMSCFLLVLILRQTGNFSVTDPVLTTFHYVEKRNGILRKNRGEGFEKYYKPLHEGRGGSKIIKIILT